MDIGVMLAYIEWRASNCLEHPLIADKRMVTKMVYLQQD